jgi:hypothetical protein
VAARATCQIRARTGGKPGLPAVTHGQTEQPLTWAGAGQRRVRNDLIRKRSLGRNLHTCLADVWVATYDIAAMRGAVPEAYRPFQAHPPAARPCLEIYDHLV